MFIRPKKVNFSASENVTVCPKIVVEVVGGNLIVFIFGSSLKTFIIRFLIGTVLTRE